ncbi:hypothetical protein GCM10010319_68380 [Streptomyces blastmyceticus]|uniref:Uncharacterized protein n=2 Tax=Streptomyces blastmyceticus TaxID=68180 RepID=A0ABP3HVQ3_9ACTN
MSSGRTHRTRLARAFATAQPMAYQKALAHVIACSEAGLLPAKLDHDGMKQALGVLRQTLGAPGVTNPVRTDPARKTAEVPSATTAKRPSLSKDPRCVALSEALKPVLRVTSPEGAGGYGGSLQANLHPADAEVLGGVPLIRAAMRRAARQLGWKVQTLGQVGERVALVLVHDVREAPAEFADALEEDRMRKGTEAMERVSAVMGEQELSELGPSPVERQTDAFRGCVLARSHG